MPALEETSACVGFWPPFLKVGNDLLVYASRIQGHSEYFTNICTRTALAADAKDFDELGPGEEPKQPKAPESKTVVMNGQVKLPDGASLLETFIADTGYNSVRTCSFEGEVSLKTIPLRGKIALQTGPDGKHHSVTDLPALGRLESGGDGIVSWERNPTTGPRIVPNQNSFAMDWNAPFLELETVGEDQVDGQPCFLVRMTPALGAKPMSACFDENSRYIVKVISTVQNQGSEMQVTTIIRDYRDEGTAKVFHQLEQQLSGLTILMNFTTVKINPEFPAKFFELPDDVSALVEGNGAADGEKK